MAKLSIGPIKVWPPVVLAPMAGVTNAPFRQLCREQGAAIYVSEMVNSRALVEGSDKTWRLSSFAPDEPVKSLQLYGSDPDVVGEAVRILADRAVVDHIDFNFGCPAAKVTRKGHGSAVPAKPKLLRRIVAAAVANAGAIPVTIKFRKGLGDHMLNFEETGRIAEGEGCAAIALHARTTEQLYSGHADWAAIARLKEVVTSIPVLGNGDIWTAEDAVAMMAETGCDGVVIGRGCLGRPWLFADLVNVFAGKDSAPIPALGEVMNVLRRHAQLVSRWNNEDTRVARPTTSEDTRVAPPTTNEDRGIRDLRKHFGWYMTGYPIGPVMRGRLAMVSTLDELDELLATLDPTLRAPAVLPRGHLQGPRPVHLPHGYLDHLDDDTPPLADGEESATSGG